MPVDVYNRNFIFKDSWDYPFDREYNQYSFHIDWGHSFLAVID